MPLMARHIGIVACSAEGAALCYQAICAEGAKAMGEHNHPEITMHTHPLARYVPSIRSGDWNAVAELMLDSARIVAAAGADFAISPDNTIHQAFDRVEADSPIPWLHIAHEVAAEARRGGYATVGVLGTKYLMEGPVYTEALAAVGIERIIPDEAVRVEINRIIFDRPLQWRYRRPRRPRGPGGRPWLHRNPPSRAARRVAPADARLHPPARPSRAA